MRRAPGLGRLLQRRHLEYNRRARRAGLLQLLGPQFKVPPPAQAQAQQRHERERAPPRPQGHRGHDAECQGECRRWPHRSRLETP